MLKNIAKKIKEDNEYDSNCSETVLLACNRYYNLGMPEQFNRVAALFGGGMGVKDTCGLYTGALMAMGLLFVKKFAHENKKHRQLAARFNKCFAEQFSSVNCYALLDKQKAAGFSNCDSLIYDSCDFIENFIKENT